MTQHVFLQVTSLCAGIAALFANKRLLSAVNPHVHFQLRSSDVREAALVASVGLHSIMFKHVRFEIFCHLEVEIALNT